MLVSLHDQKFGAKNCKTNCKLSFFLTVNASQLLLFINRANKILSCCKPIAGLQMTSQRPLSVVKDKSIFLLFGTKNPFSCKFFDKNFSVFPISGGKKHAKSVLWEMWKWQFDHQHGCLVTWLQTNNTIRRKWQKCKNPIAHSYNFMYMFLKICSELLVLVCQLL